MPIKRKGMDAYDADMRLWRERDRAYRRDQYRARRHAETDDAETRDGMLQLEMPYTETDDAETRHVSIGADAHMMKEWKERDRASHRARRRAR